MTEAASPDSGASSQALPVWVRCAAGCRLGDVQFGACLLAILIYGCFSSPTPDRFGVAEICVAALLIGAVGVRRAAVAFLPPSESAPLWRFSGWALLLYGLSVPVAVGLGRGHDIALIFRDVIPFLFLAMPLFLMPLLTIRAGYAPVLTVWVAGAGLLFALRLLVPAFMAAGHIGFSALPPHDPLYLANAPTVLFMTMTAIVLAARVMQRLTVLSIMGAVLMLTVGVIGTGAMAAAMQRASFGLGGLCLISLWGVYACRAPLRAMRIMVPALLILLFFYPQCLDLFERLEAKNTLVGFNNRIAEARAALSLVGGHWWSALFGLGWGQTVASPAVGDVTVNYTHSIVTALWLKTGLVGVGLAGAYMAGFAGCLWRVFRHYPAMALAMAAPLIIDLTLYASYKSFDFGLMLCLVPLWAGAASRLRGTGRVLYAGLSQEQSAG